MHDIKNRTASLIRVGGARVTATESRQAGVFGQSRIVMRLLCRSSKLKSDGGMGKFEPVISRTGAAYAIQFTISANLRTQDSMPTITLVA